MAYKHLVFLGLDKMSESGPDKARLASHSDAVRSALQAQFNEIIEEVTIYNLRPKKLM